MLCPAQMLGYLPSIRLVRTGLGFLGVPPGASSFRAECPALLLSREAPGLAVEESLFDVTRAASRPHREKGFSPGVCSANPS